MPTLLQPPRDPKSILELLFKLDAWANPGITKEEFDSLLDQCRRCELVMTQRALPGHHCVAVDDQSIIDLTADSDDEAEEGYDNAAINLSYSDDSLV
jgi:hypothetical protein